VSAPRLPFPIFSPLAKSMDRYDAIVLGAGPAGTSAAYFLGRAGWKVAIVERSSFPRRKVCGEFISPATHPLLAEMGLGLNSGEHTGPEVRRVALFAGREAIEAPMPAITGSGRTASRASLDNQMLEAAEAAGAAVYQPFRADSMDREGEFYCCQITKKGERSELAAPVLIAAHGSWYPGTLATQPSSPKDPSDLLAFKFVFDGASLDHHLMPLLAFPGGYGGMAHLGGGHVGLSCCIRRDVLQSRRELYGSPSAADATLRHIRATVQAVEDVLGNASEPEERLAAGPIRPGIRVRSQPGLFKVGNAAGEAHPVIAEGISMAIQGGYLLAQVLTSVEAAAANDAYERAWRTAFANRIAFARTVAALAMRPAGIALMTQAVKSLPHLLTLGASLSGKATPKFSGASGEVFAELSRRQPSGRVGSER
jgi:flavin-dependent dehydrogenase